jgi:MSHA biogenesis protein MshM
VYETHFGFRELPFGLTPDTTYVYPGSSFQEALNTLLVAAYNGEGFIKIVGEVGHGKTMLCRTFLAALREPDQQDELNPEATPREPAFVTAFMPNPYLDPRGLFIALGEEFGVSMDRTADLQGLLKAVTTRLMEIAESGKRALVCLDEVQAMPQHTLEAVRLLTNIETEKRKLLQVAIFGQPELDQKLRARAARQLLQRITFQYTLQPLRRNELAGYLDHRLRVAGYQAAAPLYSKGAVKLLHRYSNGTPRLVNILAHKTLMLAFGEGAWEVTPRHARAAAQDTPAAHSTGGWFDWVFRY